MSAPFRLDAGGRIDRTRKLRFSFDGKAYEGFAGDTLASALLANGVHLVGRSFKYHRPRGIVAAGVGRAQRARVSVGSRPALHPQSARHPGRALRRPSGAEPEPLALARSRPRRAQRRVLAALSRRLLLQDLHVAEIGLEAPLRAEDPRHGRPRARADPARCRHLRATLCPLRCAHRRRRSGRLAAALAAEAHGARVILCDEQAELGGSLLAETKATIDGKEASAWLADAVCDTDAFAEREMAVAHHGLRLFPAQHARPRRAADGPFAGARPREARASGSGRCAPSKWCSRPARSNARSSFPTTTAPASCSPMRRASILRATASSPAHARSWRPPMTRLTAPRSSLPRPASRSRRSSTSARMCRVLGPRERAAPGFTFAKPPRFAPRAAGTRCPRSRLRPSAATARSARARVSPATSC